MSKHSWEKITCNKCGHKQDFLIWQSLNGDLDPKAKQQLIDGTFFRFKCDKCGEEANVVYDTLYHDMAHNTMVHLTGESRVQEVIAACETMKKRMGSVTGLSQIAQTRTRVVTSQNRLREKAIIFEAGLDDRIVEIIKLYCWMKMVAQKKEIRDDSLYFYIDDKGEYKVEVIGGIASCDIPKEFYEQMKTQLMPILNAVGERYIVDNNFAGGVLIAMQKLDEEK